MWDVCSSVWPGDWGAANPVHGESGSRLPAPGNTCSWNVWLWTNPSSWLFKANNLLVQSHCKILALLCPTGPTIYMSNSANSHQFPILQDLSWNYLFKDPLRILPRFHTSEILLTPSTYFCLKNWFFWWWLWGVKSWHWNLFFTAI